MVIVAEVDWDRTVFMLLAPDAVARHLTTAIVERVERLGYRPVAWRVLWHRPADRTRSTNRTSPAPGRHTCTGWWTSCSRSARRWLAGAR
jgi:hypothetical protein